MMLIREVQPRTPPTWPISMFIAALTVELTVLLLCAFAEVVSR